MGIALKERTGLTGNQLKLIAMAAMTLDHIGVYLLPQMLILRIIGRLALPIYAYMIAEGCCYTRNRKKYLLRVLMLAAVCQAVYFFAMGSLYQCILVTFSMGIGFIYALDYAQKRKKWGIGAAALALAVFVCEILPDLLPGTDFAVDYGIWGVLLPALVYFPQSKWKKLGMFALGLGLLGFAYGWAQWFALAAVPLMMAYNGQRGKHAMGMVFYLYYPAHLVVIYLLGLALYA